MRSELGKAVTNRVLKDLAKFFCTSGFFERSTSNGIVFSNFTSLRRLPATGQIQDAGGSFRIFRCDVAGFTATVTTGNYPCDAAFQRAESDFMLPLVLAMLVSRQCAGCRRRSASTRNIPVPIPIPIPINSPVIAQTENIPYESCYDSIVGGDEIPWEEKIVRLESGDKVVSYDSGVVKVTSPNGDVEYTAVPWAGVGPKKKHVYVCDCDGGTLDVRNAEPL
ncbi:hypothetical protein EVAR_13021_1 [Eumeta japonica]|uniref:Uncharacterized protein n=1 Tax=Eumeta variegata TaxID=151549 RepID=A0A4C1TX40_EUMVA|nr:hypothetical protein EVAR_13021_1 [Eumeta japonica]